MVRRKRQVEKRSRIDIPVAALQDSVGFVVRIHAGRHSSPDIKKILSGMGLSKKYDGCFMKLDKVSIGKIFHSREILFRY